MDSQPPMTRTLHVALISIECFPFVKVGGLADVVGSLPLEFDAQGVRAEVVIPRFGNLERDRFGPVESVPSLSVPWGEGTRVAQVHAVRLPGSGVRVFLVEDGEYFLRASVYVDPSTGQDYHDQLERWVFFQHAALTLLARDCPDLDIIHCHEHQTALVPMYLDALYRRAGSFRKTATVLTLHNLAYQGVFPSDQWPTVGLDQQEVQPGGRLEHFGQINLMKAGILAADALTVVSPTYAEEIQTEEYGCGLDSIITARRGDLFGIVNGIDDRVWNPGTDPRIASRYSAHDLSGKQNDRRSLLGEFGFGDSRDENPVLAMISRIDVQKGFDLLLPILDKLLSEPLYFLLLGTGDHATEQSIESIVRGHPDNAAVRLTFDDDLAHRIVAGADIFLMPSRYEPCGLSQMYALRYGTAPVVRATGGLADTVEDFDPDAGTGTGFRFTRYDPDEFRAAIDRAIALWRDKTHWQRLMRNGMNEDFSWAASARRYLKVFETAITSRDGSGV